MDVVQFLLVLAVLVAAVALISAPLRRGEGGVAGADGDDADLAALHAARDAKYREIREADLDHRTGKLSDEDWETIDRQLRVEAMEILRELDRRGGAQAEPDGPRSDQTTS
jgi:hypothetical protein